MRLRDAERAGIEPEVHFQYYVKHPDCGAEWVWKGSVKWRKGVALCHNMGQCMSLAISLQKCLESLREEKRGAEEARIDCEKEER